MCEECDNTEMIGIWLVTLSKLKASEKETRCKCQILFSSLPRKLSSMDLKTEPYYKSQSLTEANLNEKTCKYALRSR